MTHLRLFAFDDERIEPFHDALMQIHRQPGTKIAVNMSGEDSEDTSNGVDIVVVCTYAAPGHVRMPGDSEAPSLHGRPEILPCVLEYAERCLRQGGYDIILLDNTVEGLNGVQADFGVNKLLPLARKGSPDALIAVVTGYPMIAEERTETIQQAFAGDLRADLWLTKKAAALCDTFCSTILLVAREKRLREQNAELRNDNQILRIQNAQMGDELRIRLHHKRDLEIISRSPVFQDAVKHAEKVAGSNRAVLITGETGTGKELIARLIHQSSKRGSFVPVVCNALAETLLESELFGHEKGAFTHAYAARPGRIEAADNGTLFLDEIGDMPVNVQVKLLRFLQEGTYERVGSSDSRKVDVRIVAATNADLRRQMDAGLFREDLFYRISQFEIHLPPLRERPEDVIAMAEFYLERHRTELRKAVERVSESAQRAILAYAWPGNIRQLDNAMYRAVFNCSDDAITLQDLPVAVAAYEQVKPDAEDVTVGSAAPAEQLEGWLGEIDLPRLERLCAEIWDSKGGCIANDPVKIVEDHGLNPFYVRAAVAAFWARLTEMDNVEVFNRIFGIPEDKTTDHRSLLTKLSRRYPKAFPPSPGSKYHGVGYLKADGNDLDRAGLDLQLT